MNRFLAALLLTLAAAPVLAGSVQVRHAHINNAGDLSYELMGSPACEINDVNFDARTVHYYCPNESGVGIAAELPASAINEARAAGWQRNWKVTLTVVISNTPVNRVFGNCTMDTLSQSPAVHYKVTFNCDPSRVFEDSFED